MSDERTRILDNLRGDELLLYVSRGGKLVTKTMQLHYAAALGAMGLRFIPTPADLTKLLAERQVKEPPKPPTPLYYRPDRKRNKGAGIAQPTLAERKRRTA